tara:strand:- start:106 stop:450 length:345 start_codon:yes stop_codon:yes gene_type:complete
MLFFKRKTAQVCGISMEPLLENGDIVFYKRFFKTSVLCIGDIVIFIHPVKKIKLIKKITAIKGEGIEVSGENINFSDDSQYFGLIHKDSIIGIVTSRIRKKSLNKFKRILNLKQ